MKNSLLQVIGLAALLTTANILPAAFDTNLDAKGIQSLKLLAEQSFQKGLLSGNIQLTDAFNGPTYIRFIAAKAIAQGLMSHKIQESSLADLHNDFTGLIFKALWLNFAQKDRYLVLFSSSIQAHLTHISIQDILNLCDLRLFRSFPHTLDFSQTGLTDLSGIDNLPYSTQYLNLSDNNINAIGTHFANNNLIEWINLEGNPIDQVTPCEIANLLRHTKLEELNGIDNYGILLDVLRMRKYSLETEHDYTIYNNLIGSFSSFKQLFEVPQRKAKRSSPDASEQPDKQTKIARY